MADLESWLLEYQLVDPLLRRVASRMSQTLSELGLPSRAEAAVALMDAGEWPPRLKPRDKDRARLAVQALLQLQKIRHHLGPNEQSAPAATQAALIAGACAADAILGDLAAAGAAQKVHRRKGGAAPKLKRTRKATRQHSVIRKAARVLDSRLTNTAKAKLLARQFPLAERTIRDILSPSKTRRRS